jgi:hypothetical protein
MANVQDLPQSNDHVLFPKLHGQLQFNLENIEVSANSSESLIN